MQLVFTRNILSETGSVKFRRGNLKDWPRQTWRELSRQLGMDLSEFTATPEAVAEANVESLNVPESQTLKPRARLQLKEQI